VSRESYLVFRFKISASRIYGVKIPQKEGKGKDIKEKGKGKKARTLNPNAEGYRISLSMTLPCGRDV
jgi:hypothetical protein